MAMTHTAPRIQYNVDGDAGPEILLVMGFGFPAAAWRAQIDGLKGAHRVATFDNVGVGGSDPEKRLGTSMRTLAADATRVLDRLGWYDTHVVGVSMGGMIAQHMVAHNPDRFRSMTLIATTPTGRFPLIPSKAGLKLFLRANTADSEEARVSCLNELLYTPEFLSNVPPEHLEQRMQDTLGQRAPRRTLLSHLQAVLSHDSREGLRQLRLPTLIVQPERDLLVRPLHSKRLKKLMPHATLKPLDAGHGCVFERAEDVNAAIAEHVAKAEGVYQRASTA